MCDNVVFHVFLTFLRIGGFASEALWANDQNKPFPKTLGKPTRNFCLSDLGDVNGTSGRFALSTDSGAMDCEADIVRQRIDLNRALRVTLQFFDARISNKMSVFEGYEIFVTAAKSHRIPT